MKAFDKEIVSGNIFRSVWKQAWPLVVLNLVNGSHGFVSHILVGHFVAAENNAANAAIGVAWQVFMVIVVFVASLFQGTNVLVARYAGQEDRRNMGRVFYQTFLCSIFVLCCVVGPVGYLISPALLNFVRADVNVQHHALPYIRILFACGAPLFLMFMITGAFQASGDPKTPLKLGILTTLLNILISSVLITGVGPFPKLGVTGAALGIVVAPLVSVAIAISLILRKKTHIPPPERFSLIPDFSVIRVVVRVGIPTGIQGVLLNIAGVFLLKYIGSLEHSSAAQAAYTICYTQLFSLVTWTAFGLRAAAGTVMGQNIGAGDPARGKRAVALAGCLGAVWASIIGLMFWLFPDVFLSAFNAFHEPVATYARSLLHYLSFSGVCLAAALGLTGGIQGSGYTTIPMYIAFLTQIVILLGLCAIFSAFDALTAERVWMCILISHASRLALTYAVFRTEKWAHIRIEIEDIRTPQEPEGV
ncbi:MAG TPA: MATE family efflux transporter [Candidatus Hydrogenedentes bacterium]|nr:MATE family efflux transporter [Candidatus Hydrogenedentota bacterium]